MNSVRLVDPHVPEGYVPVYNAFFTNSINGQECALPEGRYLSVYNAFFTNSIHSQECVLPEGGYAVRLDQSGNCSVKIVFNPFTDSLPMLSIIEGLIVPSVQVGIIIALAPHGKVLRSGVEL